MSAQALLSLPNNAIIQTGDFGETTGNISFDKAFPNAPLVFLQNAQGGAYDQVVFVISSTSTTGFSYLKFDTQTNANVTTAITCFYVAIGFP
jgi:hypothetical protein